MEKVAEEMAEYLASSVLMFVDHCHQPSEVEHFDTVLLQDATHTAPHRRHRRCSCLWEVDSVQNACRPHEPLVTGPTGG